MGWPKTSLLSSLGLNLSKKRRRDSVTSEGLFNTKDSTEGQKISEIRSRINEIESNGPPPTGYTIY